MIIERWREWRESEEGKNGKCMTSGSICISIEKSSD
jgi:hypothetical protein